MYKKSNRSLLIFVKKNVPIYKMLTVFYFFFANPSFLTDMSDIDSNRDKLTLKKQQSQFMGIFF
jgi:hypothetical protein